MRLRSLFLLVATASLPLAAAACSVVLGIDDVPDVTDGASDAGDATFADGRVDTGDGGADASPDGLTDATIGDGAPPDGADADLGDDGGPTGTSTVLTFVADVPAPNDALASAGFGSAVAFSADGKWLAVGYSAGGARAGTVTIFANVADGGSWLPSQSSQTVANSVVASPLYVGPGLAFDSNDNLTIGAPAGDVVYGCPLDAGTFGTCSQTVIPVEPGGAVTGFGAALAYDMSTSATVLYVGGPGDDQKFTQGVVEEVATGNDHNVNSTNFGYGTSLAVAGGNLIIGAPGGPTGQVYIAATSMNMTQTRLSEEIDGGREGTAVALTSGGGFALVGAPGRSRVYGFSVSENLGATAVKDGFTFTPPPSYQDQGSFGAALATSVGSAAVGAYAHANLDGAVYIYPYQTSGGPTVSPYGSPGAPLDTSKLNITGTGAQFGRALAFANDGTLAVGAPGKAAGHVYLYH